MRHGATTWSAGGKHTGATDVPLTDAGRAAARALAVLLRHRTFTQVLTSPMQRAVETCALAGLAEHARVVDDLSEWNYGDYEGRTTAEIRAERPGWTIWRDGCPGGENASQVGTRADRVIESLRRAEGDVIVFAHGHLLRVLAARWIGLPPVGGALLALDTATLSVLGWESEQAVVRRWNESP